MPRYFFHDTGPGGRRDTEGTELSDAAKAQAEAVRLMAGGLMDADDLFWDRPDRRVEVVDEEGLAVCRLHVVGWLAES